MFWSLLQHFLICSIYFRFVNGSNLMGFNDNLDFSSDGIDLEFDFSVYSEENQASVVYTDKNLPSKERDKVLRLKIREIFNAQFPTSFYNMNKFKVNNWPKHISLIKRHWTISDMDALEESLPFLRFVLRDVVESYEAKIGLDKHQILYEAELGPSISSKGLTEIILKRFKEESGYWDATRILWRLLDRSAIPQKYENVPLNSSTIVSRLIYGNTEIFNNIHFMRPAKIKHANNIVMDSNHLDNSDGIDYKARRSSLIKDLKQLFEEQFPGERYDLRSYEILNWPEEVDLLDHKRSNRDYRLIREQFHRFRFVKRPSRFTSEQQLGIDHLGDLKNVLNKDWNKGDVLQSCLKVFREETGDLSARKTNWKLLDRRDIPSRYNGIEINSRTMAMTKFFKNPEIIYNIHFFKPSEVRVSPKRKFDAFEDFGVGININEVLELLPSDDEDYN